MTIINPCPFCDLQTAKLETVKRTLKIKGVDVTSDYKVFICSKCKQEYTTDEIDEINVKNFKYQFSKITMKQTPKQ